MIAGFNNWIKHTLFTKKNKITFQSELIEAVSAEVQVRNSMKLDPATSLRDISFVIFDTETTGFYPYAGDELISIGAVLLKEGKVYRDQCFHEWINPYRDIPLICSEITGINEADLLLAPPALIVIHEFLRFAQSHYLVAHCADFDLNFINTQLRKHCKQKIKHSIIDTLTLSYHLHPTSKSHQLDDLLESYNIPIIQRHHALADAIMTAELFNVLLIQLEGLGVTTLLGLNHFLKSRQFTPTF